MSSGKSTMFHSSTELLLLFFFVSFRHFRVAVGRRYHFSLSESSWITIFSSIRGYFILPCLLSNLILISTLLVTLVVNLMLV